MSDEPTAAAPRISLRPVAPADLPVLFQHQLDPDALRMAVAHPRDAADFYAHWDEVLANPEIVARVITVEQRVVGSISCFTHEERRWVGYWVAKEHWGKGVATAAVSALLGEVRARPLYARVARSNVASLRVLERNGFVITGYQHAPATERFPACEEVLLALEPGSPRR